MRPLPIAGGVLVWLSLGGGPSAGTPAVIGLDHVPIAVADLERAVADYRALGFALKPGRAHDNGIRNQHVKFHDGTELELITAPEARDALTTTYRRHLEQGDGPAFLALFMRSPAAVTAELDRIHEPYSVGAPIVDITADSPLRYLFFGPRNASPTDAPEHFAHANTAEALVSVWLAGDDVSRERRLLEAVGATIADEEVRVPDPIRVPVARFAEGRVVLLPGSRQIVPGRPIVGVTLRVRDLAAAHSVLPHAVSNAGSLFVPPAAAHGLWIEFRHEP